MSESAHGRRLLRVGSTPDGDPLPADVLRSRTGNVVVDTERDFSAALSRVESGAVDCVIADHASDGFDGLSLLEAIRRERPNFPVFLLPATESGAVARRAVSADVTAFLPQSSPELVDQVLQALDDAVPETREDRVRMPIHDRTATEEQRLKERALDEAPVGITIGDATEPDEPLIYVNDSFEAITGYDKEEAIGVNCRFLQGADTDAETTVDIREAVENTESVSAELLNYRADGSTFWNNLAISPIRDDDGNVTNFVAFQQDVTERKEAEAAIREERETLRRLLDRVEGLVSDLSEILVRADNRDEIHRMTVSRLGSVAKFDRAWIGTYDPTTHTVSIAAHNQDRLGEQTIALDADRPSADRLAATLEADEIQRLEDAATLDPPLGFESGQAGSGVLIPLSYRRTTYGVLAVFDADPEAFDGTERAILGALGRVIGAAINDVLSKRTLTTDVTITIEVDLHDPSLFLADLASTATDPIAYRGTQVHDDGRVAFLFAVSAADEDTILAAEDRYEAVTDVSVLSRAGEQLVVEIITAGAEFVDALASYGANVGTVAIDSQSVRVRFTVATEQNGRAIVEALETAYEDVELIAYHESGDAKQAPRSFAEAVEADLTDRQLTALQKAYTSGFFEWPRQCEGEDLAASMDVVPSTYYQHLRTAEKKLMRAFFEDD
ncbi:PAS domain-containing protein [Halorhabdus sp. CBA1104]|uniref:bacterio-opsin activator domain-containing protein n=1 Tax=unclassified Halorhabdus TaxID=2621901 RepID=UPI0012B2AB98|nr:MULTISPECIES: bacterio-opsin activator domain-containing protein [unclassified Halorhabdus]QGN06490.1 PAS domain-containing protein [Halorhabdus sp. CBA1104]